LEAYDPPKIFVSIYKSKTKIDGIKAPYIGLAEGDIWARSHPCGVPVKVVQYAWKNSKTFERNEETMGEGKLKYVETFQVITAVARFCVTSRGCVPLGYDLSSSFQLYIEVSFCICVITDLFSRIS
jgi:hypothetical protein